MNIIWHIAKKDLCRFGIGVLLLVSLIALKLFLIEGALHAEITREWSGRMFRYQTLLLVVELIFTFFVAAAIVQEDFVSEPGAFWQTLPITRRQLLGAKLLSVFLICALPAVLTLAAGWIMFGLPTNLLGWPLALLAETQLGLCILAFAFGSLTRNAAHLVFWVIGVVLSFSIPTLLIEPILNRSSLVPNGTGITHLCLMLAIWGITAASMILNQFAGQAKRRSIALLAVGVALSFLAVVTVDSRFALDLCSTLLPAQTHLDDKIAQLKATVVSAEIAKQSPDSDPISLLRISVQGVDQGYIIRPLNFVGHWKQAKVTAGLVRSKIYQARDDSLKRTVENAFGFPNSSGTNDLNFGAESTISAEDATILGERSTPFRGQIEFFVNLSEVVGQMELTNGASLSSRFGSFKIGDVASYGNIIQFDLEGRDSSLTPDSGWPVSFAALVSPPSRVQLALVNKKTRTVVTPARTTTGIGAYAYGIALGRAKYQFVIPSTDKTSLSPADWIVVEVRNGANLRSLKSFGEDVFLKEVPAIERDPAWTD